MNVVKHWEELVSDLKRRLQNGDESFLTLLVKSEAELEAAREKEESLGRDRHGN